LQRKNPQIRFFNWNVTLDKAIRSFVAEKSTVDDPVTAIYFSSHKVFTALLDNPTSHGFPQGDIKKSGGSIWMDHLHPTSAVHLIVANELDGFLSSISPFTPSIVAQTQNE
jgi:phospholipase/lecithinase/hemolysin